jgi:hypothetical protein
MAEKKSADSDTRKSFQDFLSACPAADAPATGLVVAGMVLRSAKEGSFVLRTADDTQHELPVEAVEDFTVISGGAGVRLAQLSLNIERLGADLAAALGRAPAAGGLKFPLEKAPPIDKLPPLDTLKELPGDTLKEQPFDTLKEIGGGGGDTIKEQPADTLKELIETIKEVGKDPLGDGGGGTGITDTFVENIPGGGDPGGPVIQP